LQAAHHSRDAVQAFDCGGKRAGRCKVVDIASLGGQDEQGAALQSVAAQQLAVSPASLLLLLNAQQLRDTGISVLLQLAGVPSISKQHLL
jgi:hypothetical protein